MGLAAVRVRVAGDDFYLLAEENSVSSAESLADLLDALRDDGGALRLRPRLAPPEAPWVHGDTTDGSLPRSLPQHAEGAQPLTGDETPGTAWRDVPGESIQEIETLDLEQPTVLWHWAVGSQGGREIG